MLFWQNKTKAKTNKQQRARILPQSHVSLKLLGNNATLFGIRLLSAILIKFNVCHGDKLLMVCFILLVMKSNIMSAFHNFKRKFRKNCLCYFFLEPKLVYCKEGCLKISVINKPRGYNFLDSGTLYLLLKAVGGNAILLSIYYSYFTIIFYEPR